jgi:hypothetical protein
VAFEIGAGSGGVSFELMDKWGWLFTRAGGEGGEAVEDEARAAGFGKFERDSLAEFTSEDYHVIASASAVSTLTERVLHFAGEMHVASADLDAEDDAAGPVDAMAVVRGVVTFRLTEPQWMRFATTVAWPRDYSDPTEPGNEFSLLREGDEGEEPLILVDALRGGEAVQLLEAGTYTFRYYHDATTYPGVPGEGEANAFETELRLEAVAAVPLPGGLWVGAGLFGVVYWRVRGGRR